MSAPCETTNVVCIDCDSYQAPDIRSRRHSRYRGSSRFISKQTSGQPVLLYRTPRTSNMLASPGAQQPTSTYFSGFDWSSKSIPLRLRLRHLQHRRTALPCKIILAPDSQHSGSIRTELCGYLPRPQVPIRRALARVRYGHDSSRPVNRCPLPAI